MPCQEDSRFKRSAAVFGSEGVSWPELNFSKKRSRSDTLSPPRSTSPLCCESITLHFGPVQTDSRYSQGSDATAKVTIPSSPSVSEEEVSDIFQVDRSGNSRLHWNIIYRRTEATLEMIKKAPSFDYLSFENSQSETPLHVAARTNQPVLVRRLICAGATVDATDAKGRTALHLACLHGHTKVIDNLLRPVDYKETLQNSYTIPFQRIPQNMELRDRQGQTCLMLALKKKKRNTQSVLESLIKSGSYFLFHNEDETLEEKLSRFRDIGRVSSDEESDSESEDDEVLERYTPARLDGPFDDGENRIVFRGTPSEYDEEDSDDHVPEIEFPIHSDQRPL